MTHFASKLRVWNCGILREKKMIFETRSKFVPPLDESYGVTHTRTTQRDEINWIDQNPRSGKIKYCVFSVYFFYLIISLTMSRTACKIPPKDLFDFNCQCYTRCFTILIDNNCLIIHSENYIKWENCMTTHTQIGIIVFSIIPTEL